MTTKIRIFNNPQFGEICTLMGENSEPLFCAADVCKALGYANPRDAISKHVDEGDVAKRDTIDNLGRKQPTSFINESGLYALIGLAKETSDSAWMRGLFQPNPFKPTADPIHNETRRMGSYR